MTKCINSILCSSDKVVISEFRPLKGYEKMFFFTMSPRVGRIRNGNKEASEMSYKYDWVSLCFVRGFYFDAKYALLPS